MTSKLRAPIRRITALVCAVISWAAAGFHRVWRWLGTAGSVRAVTGGMIVYAILIAGLTTGYARVSGCVSAYANESARNSEERLDAAAQDRAALRATGVALRDAQSLDNIRGAAGDLVATIDLNDQRRAQNPPPAPPDERC